MGALLACLLAVAGCGDDSGEGSASADAVEVNVKPGQLSKGEFIQQTNAVCKEGQAVGIAQLRSYLQKEKISDASELSDRQAAEVLDSVVTPTYEEEISRIGALGAPAADVKKVEAMLEAMSKGLLNARNDPFESLKRNLILGNASQLAASYGLTACSISWG